MGQLSGDKRVWQYRGDRKPLGYSRGGQKIFGWHAQTVSGTGTISLDGAYNVPPDALVIDGKCVQDTTTGKNLLVFPYYDGNSKTSGGVTFTVNPDGSIHAAGTATSDATFYINNAAGFVIPAGTYTFSGCPSGGNAGNGYYMRINYSGFVLTDIGAGATGTRASDTSSTVPIYIRVREGATVNHTFYPQLELGSAATAYEPYTGGIPSPNPDYPAPITTIIGDLTITGANGDLSDTATASLGAVEICSVPDGTKDEHDTVTGIVTKRCGKAVLDGSGWWDYSNPTTRAGVACHVFMHSGVINNQTQTATTAISDLFQIANDDVAPTIKVVRQVLYLALPQSTLSGTADAIKAWLAANPVTFIYKLAEPYTIQLTPTDLPAVRTGIKTLSVSANITPTFTATVKAMDD